MYKRQVLLWPASAVVSDSLAASDSWAALVAICSGYAAGAWLEWYFLHSLLSAATWPVFAATVFSTYGQDLLVDTTTCNSLCLAHNSLLVLLVALELAGSRLRGASLELVGASALIMAGTALAYRMVLLDDDFDASDTNTRRFLAVVGSVELVSFLSSRTLAALASYETPWFRLARGDADRVDHF